MMLSKAAADALLSALEWWTVCDVDEIGDCAELGERLDRLRNEIYGRHCMCGGVVSPDTGICHGQKRPQLSLVS